MTAPGYCQERGFKRATKEEAVKLRKTGSTIWLKEAPELTKHT